MAKGNYQCSCFAEYPNVAHKNKNGTWKCIDKYEKCEDWVGKYLGSCKTHCRRKDKKTMIEIKRKVKKEVEETVTMDLIPYWVIRIVKVGAYNNKEVVGEVECQHEPTEQEIADVLVGHINEDVFASVVKNYRLVEVNNE